MAKLKVPLSLLHYLLSYIKKWLASILDFIAIADKNGNLNQEILQNLQNIQDYLDPLIPLEIAEDFIEDIFKDYSKDSTFKLAILRILHFPDRGTRLNLGKNLVHLQGLNFDFWHTIK